jgi:hypothetical protein
MTRTIDLVLKENEYLITITNEESKVNSHVISAHFRMGHVQQKNVETKRIPRNKAAGLILEGKQSPFV